MTIDERSQRLSAGDQWRRDWYLSRVDWHLATLVSGRERRRIITSLRDDITGEASQHGLRATLSGLGDPRVLAQDYADGDARRRPLWTRGIVAGMSALLLYWVVFFSCLLGMFAVVAEASITEVRTHFLFIEVIAFADDTGFGVGWTDRAAWLIVPLVIVATVFLLTSRAWRGWRKQR